MKKKVRTDVFTLDAASRIYSEIAHLKAYGILKVIIKGNDSGMMIIRERISRVKKYLSTELKCLDASDRRQKEVIKYIKSAVKDSPN